MEVIEYGSRFLGPQALSRQLGVELSGGLRGHRGFQVDGKCLFSLLQIPMAVMDISSAQHPVKAGLSDAFMILNSSPEVPGESPGACVTPSSV